MFIMGLFSWWYGAGWRQRAEIVKERLLSSVDYFSIDLLLRTYLSPFRQISAGNVDGPIGAKAQAFFDKLISRIIGAIVRTIIIAVGVTTILFHAILGGVILAVWAIVPFLPLIGAVMFTIGWVPTWI